METASEAHERFSTFLELIPDPTVAVDSEGHIVHVNEEATVVFGYPRDRLVGLPVDELVPGKLHDAQFARRADGSEFPAEISLSTSESPSGPLSIAAIRDVSDRLGFENERERLANELALNQSRRMESIGELAGGIAHDFNNLLGVIINYADFVEKELDELPEVREDVRQIQSAAHRAVALTRQLLIFSQRGVEHRQPVNLNASFEELEKLLRRVLGEQIELVTDFEPELWTVLADPGQIEQVAINLAVNARDAIPTSGTLEISTSNVILDDKYEASHPSAPNSGRYVRLTVSDSGSGMDRETLARAFEPFFTTKPKPEGTGLGLATVYGIVVKHGGNIFLYSEPDKGTTVKIHLPASFDLPELINDSDDGPWSVRGDGERVLVVEDEQSVRRMVVRALSTNGFRVVDFPSAQEALELLADEDEHFSLLLTDMVMPGIQGSELAERALTLRPELPVLFMSGYNELSLGRIDLAEGKIDLLEKPFSVKDLIGEVLRVIAQGSQ